MLNDKINGT